MGRRRGGRGRGRWWTLPLSDGAVAFWGLNEASGVRDDAVGAHNLTDVNTVTQAAGKVGNAAQFTAANAEYLEVADHADFSPASFTISVWVYLDTKGTLQSICVKDDIGANREFQLLYDVGDDRFTIYFGGSGTHPNEGTSPATATWYHVIAGYSAAAGGSFIQVNNGTEATAVVANPGDSSASFRLGARGNGSGYLNGRLDAVGFWSRVLTANERTELWNDGAGGEYPFDDRLTTMLVHGV